MQFYCIICDYTQLIETYFKRLYKLSCTMIIWTDGWDLSPLLRFWEFLARLHFLDIDLQIAILSTKMNARHMVDISLCLARDNWFEMNEVHIMWLNVNKKEWICNVCNKILQVDQVDWIAFPKYVYRYTLANITAYFNSDACLFFKCHHQILKACNYVFSTSQL